MYVGRQAGRQVGRCVRVWVGRHDDYTASH